MAEADHEGVALSRFCCSGVLYTFPNQVVLSTPCGLYDQKALIRYSALSWDLSNVLKNVTVMQYQNYKKTSVTICSPFWVFWAFWATRIRQEPQADPRQNLGGVTRWV